MTRPGTESLSSATSTRRTLAVLAAWGVAAFVAGVPGAANTASAEQRVRELPTVVHTGPECFAGKSAPPKASQKQ